MLQFFEDWHICAAFETEKKVMSKFDNLRKNPNGIDVTSLAQDILYNKI